MPTFFDDDDYDVWEKDQIATDHELDDESDDDEEDEHPRDDTLGEWEEEYPDDTKSPFDVESEDD